MSCQNMDTEIKAKWLAALRSGKYKQTQGRLRDSEGRMCCLGVLCDVIDPDGWSEDKEVNTFPGGMLHHGCRSSPNSSFDSVHGLHQMDLDPLIERNDGLEGRIASYWTFPRIANWIEKNL